MQRLGAIVLLSCLVTAALFSKSSGKNIYLYAPTWKVLFERGKKINNQWVGGDRDQCDLHLVLLRAACKAAGYTLVRLSRLQGLRLGADDRLVCFDFDPQQVAQLQGLPKEKLILLLWESVVFNSGIYERPMHDYFGTIFTLFDELVDNKKYYKLYCPQPYLTMSSAMPLLQERKLVAMFAGAKRSSHPFELYSKRLQHIIFYNQHHPDEFDLYGPGWASDLTVYKGYVDSKIKTLQNYKFCICYENAYGVAGYITEKIGDCFAAGCIPVYWGAPNIADYVPADCFIDGSQVQDPAALYTLLHTITAEQYEGYIARIRQFLNSDAAQQFSPRNFVRIFFNKVLSQEPPAAGW